MKLDEAKALKYHVKLLAILYRYTVVLQKGKLFIGDGKRGIPNRLKNVNNGLAMLKYLEDDADILTEFGAFETEISKTRLKQ
eukprot:snap_masked-scaffold_17-processed-gene-6.49-mRNA-1 protein AED:1.00 eAED:1.00 QI:0/0/0/0/1/1/2/0/81